MGGTVLITTGNLQKEVTRLTALGNVARLLNQEHDPEKLLSLIMDHAVALTGAERGFLLLSGDLNSPLASGTELRFEAIRSRVARHVRWGEIRFPLEKVSTTVALLTCPHRLYHILC